MDSSSSAFNENQRRKAVAEAIRYLRKKDGDYSEIIKSLRRRDLDKEGEDLLRKDFVQGPAQQDEED